MDLIVIGLVILTAVCVGYIVYFTLDERLRKIEEKLGITKK